MTLMRVALQAMAWRHALLDRHAMVKGSDSAWMICRLAVALVLLIAEKVRFHLAGPPIDGSASRNRARSDSWSRNSWIQPADTAASIHQSIPPI